jgi:tRNA modification GTPase
MNSANLVKLENAILKKINIDEINTGRTVVTNLRHQQEMLNTKHGLQMAIQGIDKDITNDILAMDLPACRRRVLKSKDAEIRLI